MNNPNYEAFDPTHSYGQIEDEDAVSWEDCEAAARNYLPPSTRFKLLACPRMCQRAWYYAPDPTHVPNPDSVNVIKECVA